MPPSTTKLDTRGRIAVVIGTRPEAIKMAPIVHALQRSKRLRPVVIATSQHREMLQPMLQLFRIRPDHDLDLMVQRQSLGEFVARALASLEGVIASEKPKAVLVQGDTSTAMAGALAAFYQKIPCGHVEAGLRSGDMENPFPEELNRRVIALAARFHFAPTDLSRRNLEAERIPSERIFVTGNTVVDAVRWMHRRGLRSELPAGIHPDRPLVLVTAHRRENLGKPLRRICEAIRRLARKYPRAQFVYPVHLNPRVQETVRAELGNLPQVRLMPPASYPELLALMDLATVVLTDSGGIQEESASLARPVLILREVTERPEVVEAGFGELVGTDPDRIVTSASVWLDDPARRKSLTRLKSPFGDGRAGSRTVEILEREL